MELNFPVFLDGTEILRQDVVHLRLQGLLDVALHLGALQILDEPTLGVVLPLVGDHLVRDAHLGATDVALVDVELVDVESHPM